MVSILSELENKQRFYTHSKKPLLEKCMKIMKECEPFKSTLDKLEEDLWSLPTDFEVTDLWFNIFLPFCFHNQIIIEDLDEIRTKFKDKKLVLDDCFLIQKSKE